MKKVDLYYYGKVMKELKFYGSYRRLDGEEEYGVFWFWFWFWFWFLWNLSGGWNNEVECCINYEEEFYFVKGNWILIRE